MKIHPHVYILEIPMDWGGGASNLNLAYVQDPAFGGTLFDTGMPDQDQAILAAIESEGLPKSSLKRIVITHADIDHIGSLKALKEATGAQVVCLDIERDYVTGAVPPFKWPSPERFAENPQMKAVFDSLERTGVDAVVRDGEVIPGAVGAVAVATPGHTAGHMSVFLADAKVLITGDALSAADGRVSGPNEWATPDMPTALASLKKLAALDVEQIIVYHGGLVKADANKQLRQLAGV